MVDRINSDNRVQTYRNYLENRINEYSKIERLESLAGFATTDKIVSSLQTALDEFDKLFPKLKKSDKSP